MGVELTFPHELEAEVDHAPMGILLMPGGVDPARVLAGELHDEAF